MGWRDWLQDVHIKHAACGISLHIARSKLAETVMLLPFKNSN